ncbi:MAG: ribose transport system substrate-binding protein [Rhodospirillaceae bacterium]|jgi:ribose transport system substrate-binding protein|nr:ribose transport system substrate-binding protein [Rhodospirillaceae bacterium]
MKRLLFAAVAVALFAAPGLAGAQQKYKFALVPKAMNNPFFDLARDGCMKAQTEIPNVECVYIGPAEHTETEQVQIVQDLISKGIDGIAVSPSNAAAMGVALKAAKNAGIPTLTWDADLLPQDRQYRAAFVGTHNYDIGVNLAKIAQKLKPSGGKICLQTGGASAANHNERLQGIRDTLGGHSGTTPPGEQLKGENGWTEVAGCPLITNDDSATAVQQLQDILGKYADLDVYITTGAFTQWSDNAFRQAMEPYKDKLKNGQLVFVAADTLAMQMQQLKDGFSNGQVGQRPFEMGRLAMARLLDLKNGKTLTDPEYTGLDVCTKDNADSCMGK